MPDTLEDSSEDPSETPFCDMIRSLLDEDDSSEIEAEAETINEPEDEAENDSLKIEQYLISRICSSSEGSSSEGSDSNDGYSSSDGDSSPSKIKRNRFLPSKFCDNIEDSSNSSVQKVPCVPPSWDPFWNNGDRRTLLYRLIRHLLPDTEFDCDFDQNCANLNETQVERLSQHVPITCTGKATSIGTLLHRSGRCKPCIFMVGNSKKPNCMNGFTCLFCHHANHNKTERQS
eukprot:GHVP01058840.1.p1 GENE.GHVP01058840.1~~GHVP01058840.1.p1  ORF type:complete len:231 (+),score=35.14 GHVP01058840.1:413-1105(+)